MYTNSGYQEKLLNKHKERFSRMRQSKAPVGSTAANDSSASVALSAQSVTEGIEVVIPSVQVVKDGQVESVQESQQDETSRRSTSVAVFAGPSRTMEMPALATSAIARCYFMNFYS